MSAALKAGEALATRLRLRKAVRLQALEAGLTQLEIPRPRLWAPEDAAALAAWDSLPQPRPKAGDLLASRLCLWLRMDQAVAARGEDGQELHICEVWEGTDEVALSQWETLLAHSTGQVPLFAEVAYA